MAAGRVYEMTRPCCVRVDEIETAHTQVVGRERRGLVRKIYSPLVARQEYAYLRTISLTKLLTGATCQTKYPNASERCVRFLSLTLSNSKLRAPTFQLTW